MKRCSLGIIISHSKSNAHKIVKIIVQLFDASSADNGLITFLYRLVLALEKQDLLKNGFSAFFVSLRRLFTHANQNFAVEADTDLDKQISSADREVKRHMNSFKELKIRIIILETKNNSESHLK